MSVDCGGLLKEWQENRSIDLVFVGEVHLLYDQCSKGPPLGHKLDTVVDSARTGRIDADRRLCQETWESCDYVTTRSGVRIFHHGTPKELHLGARGRAGVCVMLGLRAVQVWHKTIGTTNRQ